MLHSLPITPWKYPEMEPGKARQNWSEKPKLCSIKRPNRSTKIEG